MKTSFLHIVFLSTLIAGVHLTIEEPDIDEACNCDHCFNINVNGSKNKDISSTVYPLNKEDTDGNGLLEICARSRDLPDRNFQSLCHMHCNNRCTKFKITVINEGKIKRYTATGYRTNYYKLRDGPCKN